MTTQRRPVIFGVLLLLSVLGAIELLDLNDQMAYAITRLVFQVIGTAFIFVILRQALRNARRAKSDPDQRLRQLTVVFILAEITTLITISVVASFNQPPPTDLLRATIGVVISVSLAFGCAIIALTEPKNDNP